MESCICRGQDCLCMQQGGAVNVAISNERLTRFGLVSMIDYYTERSVTCQVD